MLYSYSPFWEEFIPARIYLWAI